MPTTIFRFFPEITLLIGSISLYSLTLVRLHTYDSLNYVLAIENGIHDAILFLHPHHLLFNPLASAYLKNLNFLGLSVGSFPALQWFNAFFGSLTLVVLYRILRFRKKKKTAFLITSTLAVMYGYWLYSVEFEVYMLSVFFLVLAYNRILSESEPSYMEQFWLGLILGLAILSHQMNLLFLFVVFGMRYAKRSFRFAIKSNIIAFLTAGFLVSFCYLTAFRMLNLNRIDQMWYWTTSYLQRGSWGGFDHTTIREILLGTSKALLSPNGFLSSIEWITGISIFILGLIGAYVGRSEDDFSGNIIWIAVYGLFVSWWEPLNPEFWLFVLPPTIMLISPLSDLLYAKSRFLAILSLSLLAFGMGLYNWRFGISKLREPLQDARVTTSLQLKECVAPQDRLIIADFSLYPWLGYYLQIEVYPIERAFLIQEILASSTVQSGAFTEIHNYILQSMDQSRRIFLLEEALEGSSTTWKHRVDSASLHKQFSRYRLIETSCQIISPYRIEFGLQQLYELVEPE